MSEQLNLFDRLAFYEGSDVEYKGARGGLPRDLWETYSAFANTDGGLLWLGITQRDGQLDFHGVPEPEKLIADFWNTINNRSKTNINLLRNQDVRIHHVENTKCVLISIRVPRADRHQRPVFIGLDPLRGTYRRNNEGDYKCAESEVRRMFSDQSDEPADSRVLDNFSFADLHIDSLRQFRNRFASRGSHPWLAEDDAGLLSKLGGWRKDRRSGREGLTLAGLLMFGREQAIRDPSAAPGFQLDYREHFDENPDIRWTDRLTLDGHWEGNLFQFHQLVKQKLSIGPGIKRPFGRDAEGYRAGESPVIEALEEALVNALIHADYAGQGGIVIDRWPNRLEFTNPGTLLVSREQLLQGGVSECRNKSLQLMFQMLGAGDRAGSGIDKIRSSWSAERWQSPVLQESHQPDRVSLRLPMSSLLPEDVLTILHQRFGANFDALSGDEIQALVTAQTEGVVTNQQLQGMLAMHRVDITRMLGGLVAHGFLVSEGVGRGTRYSLAQGTPPLSVGTPPLSVGTPPLSVGTPPLNSPSFSLPEDDPRWAIAASVREKRSVKPDVMRTTILTLCANDYLALHQLASLLGRGAKRLHEKHLVHLTRNRQLQLRFPDNPNHPHQAYRASCGCNAPVEDAQ
ncbi:MAG: putative DNA binding domain-containing protein [Betaproteobacteria bacterium]|nr:putative DNA binding domain-containing protein [Betaproteobacteria bacterium]